MTTSELIIFLFSCTVISMLRFLLSSREGGGGGGLLLTMAYTGRLRPKVVSTSWLQVYEG